MSEVAEKTSAAPSPLAPEDLARGRLYGVIGRLYYAPPDPNLLAEISRGAPDGEGGGNGLAWSWRNLQEACRTAYPALVRQEYDTLFVGVGKSEVTPYLSAYAEAAAPDRYLVRLREQLSRWGLGRREGVFEVEDHVSGICDVMRWLIEGGESLGRQKEFFEEFAYPGIPPFCVALRDSASGRFYKHVAALTLAFFEIEKAALAMSEG
ncbi:MAG: molecular chaperone TorD family protein [Burkholderiales bacterium]|nr:molecular chaperone TorD family protein [Burkholderiales bacterium]